MVALITASYLVEVLVQQEWSRNGLRFASESEAESYGADMATRWTQVAKRRVIPSTDPVNASYKDHTLVQGTDSKSAA